MHEDTYIWAYFPTGMWSCVYGCSHAHGCMLMVWRLLGKRTVDCEGVSDSGVCNRVIDLPGCWAFWRMTTHKPGLSCKEIWGKKSSGQTIWIWIPYTIVLLLGAWGFLRLEHPDFPDQWKCLPPLECPCWPGDTALEGPACSWLFMSACLCLPSESI